MFLTLNHICPNIFFLGCPTCFLAFEQIQTNISFECLYLLVTLCLNTYMPCLLAFILSRRFFMPSSSKVVVR